MEQYLSVEGAAYRLGQLLGHGKGGYSYLAWDLSGKPVVLKQIHHEPCSYYTFGDKMAAELSDYQKLCRLGLRMPELLCADLQAERLVKEYIAGPTAYELVAQGALPEACVEQVLVMCRLLYPAGLNIDYFPTNFIWTGKYLYYVDYECNPYADEWNFENWGRKYWSRTPEFLEYASRYGLVPGGDAAGNGRLEEAELED